MKPLASLAESRWPLPAARWPPTWRAPSRSAPRAVPRSTAPPATARSAPAAWARRCCPRAWSGCAAPRRTEVIAQGRAATQMPGFARQARGRRDRRARAVDLHAGDAGADLERGRHPRLAQSQIAGAATLPAKPAWTADPMNLFVVVEGGDHHVSLVDGDRFEVIHRFARASRCTAGRSSRPTGASSTSARATAGSPSTTCGT